MKKSMVVVGMISILVVAAFVPATDIQDLQRDCAAGVSGVPHSTLGGNTLYVGGSGPGNYTTIQAAIDNASDGDTVYVYPGKYVVDSLALIVDKAISLIGHEKNSTVIWGAVVVKSDAVNVSSFTIQADRFATSAVELEGNHSSLYDNNIESLDGVNYGICVYGSYNRIISNTVRHRGESDSQCPGILLWGSSYNYVSKNHVFGNGFGSTISLDNQFKAAIIGNTLLDKGIRLGYSVTYHDHWFTSHNIQNNTLDGKPIYYFNGLENASVSVDASEIIVVNATDFTMKNGNFRTIIVAVSSNFQIAHSSIATLTVLHSEDALIGNNTFHQQLTCSFVNNFTCDNNTISCKSFVNGKNNTITNNDIAASLDIRGRSNRVEGNTVNYIWTYFCDFTVVQRNTMRGISTLYSSHNTVRWNEINGGFHASSGVTVGGMDNEFYQNNITNCTVGMKIPFGSLSNSVTCNNFIGNEVDAKITGSCMLYYVLPACFMKLIYRNKVAGNYWDTKHFVTPKPIYGSVTVTIGTNNLFEFPWCTFDWRPTKEPTEWWAG